MRNFLIGIFLSLLSVVAVAQVNLQFMPELQGRNLDGLLNLRILNAGGTKKVMLGLTVTERKSGKVVSIRTDMFTLNNGNNSIPTSVVRTARIQFSNSRISTIIQQNGFFPEGDYEYCFIINPGGASNPDAIVEQCFSYEVVPSAPLSLIEPSNRDKICEKRPIFSWQPSFPQIPGSGYQLVLVEIKERQSAVEALNYNLPVLSQQGLINPILPYPSVSKELQNGKKYAWQVSAYKNQTVLNRSEVWEFTVGCEDTIVESPILPGNFRYLDDLAKGNYYIAKGSIRFFLDNPYSEQKLNYSITGITDPKRKIKVLRKVKLKKGRNEVTIDLKNLSSFKNGYTYILHATLPDGTIKSLRFLYRQAE